MSQSKFRVSKHESNVKKRTRLGGNHQVGACCACKRKKKKCDGKYPKCSSCESSGLDCTIVDLATKRVVPRDYIEQLETKVATLQKELENSSKPRALEMEIGYITLGVGSESSRYIGDSSAYSIAKAITGSIDYYNEKAESRIEAELTEGLNQIPFIKPSKTLANCYLSSYKDNVQCQYPFLDWNFITEAFNNVMSEESTKSNEKLFFIYMIFAIGSQLQSYISDSNTGVYTKMYYNKALENIKPLVEATSLATVQTYLILSTFSQKMPNASSIWQTTGLAIRTAVILGLHREPYKKGSRTSDLGRRVFWCAYGMERLSGVILGRPFGISDLDIDISLPDHTEEYGISNHVIKLRRLQSSICTFVYKPIQIMDSMEEIDATRVQIMVELNDWVSTFPFKSAPSSIFETNNWAKISYHNSLILLLRPVLLEVARLKEKSSSRSLEWFKVFAHSASAICINYKELRGKGKLGYPWVSMHCVFVSGLSFLYCLWIDLSLNVLDWKRKGLIYETISSCSSILAVFSEKFRSANMFRSTFDRISSVIMAQFDRGSEELMMGMESIGIDQYQSYDLPDTDEESYNDPNLWEFIDSTSDKFLRDIFYDLENGLTLK